MKFHLIRITIFDNLDNQHKLKFVHNRSKSGRPSISEQNNRLITDYFENTSSQFIREASAELSILYGSIRKVLKVSGYYPYKIKLHQHLEPEDFAIRKSMSEDILLN